MRQSWEGAENRTWRFWSAQILPHAVCGLQVRSDGSVTDLQNAATDCVATMVPHVVEDVL